MDVFDNSLLQLEAVDKQLEKSCWRDNFKSDSCKGVSAQVLNYYGSYSIQTCLPFGDKTFN